MLMDLRPLRVHRDFRLLFLGQLVSAFGTFFTYVALPVEVYNLTKSSLVVGLIGVVQLVPLALTALLGGAMADAKDRRRLLLIAETLLMVGSLTMAANAALPHPSVVLLFVAAALMSAVNGFHSPALESLTPRLVTAEELPAVSALASLRGNTAFIAGPALAGLSIAAFGVPVTFGIDAASYAFSLAMIALIRSIPPSSESEPAGLSSIVTGLKYAISRPELIGTYLVDFLAVGLAMPVAVFPALASNWGGARAAGYLYSSMSIGSLLVTLTSGWTGKVERRGAAIVVASFMWGVAIAGVGFATSLPQAIFFLALAGAADMVSGLFRMTIWNETIPSHLRGRMAGIEQLSYMSGPLLGNARAGFLAERIGLGRSIVAGGVTCAGAIALTVPLLPAFWRYRHDRTESGLTGRP